MGCCCCCNGPVYAYNFTLDNALFWYVINANDDSSNNIMAKNMFMLDQW